MRQRVERRALALKMIRRVDCRLPVEPAHLAERVRDCIGRHGDEHDFGARGVTTILSDFRHLVTRSAPALREAAPDVSPADDCDLHGSLPFSLPTDNSTEKGRGT